MLHILPEGFMKIRHYGISVNSGYWVSIIFYIHEIEPYLQDGEVEDMILRIYKEHIYEDYPFRICFKEEKMVTTL